MTTQTRNQLTRQIAAIGVVMPRCFCPADVAANDKVLADFAAGRAEAAAAAFDRDGDAIGDYERAIRSAAVNC